MKTHRKLLLVSVTATACFMLQGCELKSLAGLSPSSSSEHYDYNNYYENRTADTSSRSNNSTQDTGSYNTGNYQPKTQHVTVPDSNHMSSSGSSSSYRPQNRGSVGRQRPNAYTVEVVTDKNNSNVGSSSQKQQDTGVYGTYQNKEKATKALQKLPAGL